MFSSLQARRAEEKLGLVLERVDAIRRRLNSLVWQRILFGVPAGIITAGALVALAAFFLSPLAFLIATTALGACLAVGLFRTVGGSWRMRVDSETAASIADERAGLKGRLETIVQIGCAQQRASAETGIAGEQPSLWPYLIEDTLGSRDEFEPARIERRRFSRSLYALLASLAFAATIVPLIARVRARPAAAAADRGDITLNLKNLHLRRVDPGEPGVEAQADAETMGRLEERLAEEGYGTGASKSSKSLLDRARQLAGNLQRKLTGRSAQRPRMTLKLSDASPPGSGMRTRRPKVTPPSPSPDDTDPSRQGRGQNAGSRPLGPPGSSASPGTNPNGAGNPFGAGAPQKPHSADHGGGPATNNPAGQANRGQAGGSGVSHGSGAAPETLFGSATEPKLSGDGFEIAIEAPPMPDGSQGGAHGHLPPRVRAQLNAEQHSDEPIARAAVPEEDRAAIKQVFER